MPESVFFVLESITPTQALGHSAQCFALCVRSGTDAGGSKQKRDDMFLIAGRCGTLIRRDKGAGSRLCQNARKS